MLTLRKRKLYKTMDNYTACSIAEGFCEGEGASKIDQLTAWQWLHDTGKAYLLQGWYGRTAQALIEQGMISK